MSTAVLVGTLDTKGREYEFVRDELRRRGLDVVLVDVGILNDSECASDVSAEAVAEAVGYNLHDLRESGEGNDNRSRAMDVMRRGAIEIVRALRDEGRCDGVLGLGGSGGSSIISGVMRSLPFGVPKLLISTMASGDVSSYIQSSDLYILNPVTDIAGLHRLSRPLLRTAAGGLAGMINASLEPMLDDDRPAVAVTMLGVTTPAALEIVSELEAAGFSPIVFHAVGSGGRAMEELLDAGVLTGVIDLTVKEVTDDLLGGMFVAGPDRMRTAGRHGYPQVVVPGAVEVINFGPWETVPTRFRDGSRPFVRHNEQVTAVRATHAELLEVADELAARLNTATGPVEVLVPTLGFDSYAAPDGPFEDKDADHAFAQRLATRLRADITVTWLEHNINSPEFARAVSSRFIECWNDILS